MPLKDPGEYILSDQINFIGGINTKTDPRLLTNQTPDASNVLFDEEMGAVVKRNGVASISEPLPSTLPTVKTFTFVRENGETILLIQDVGGNIYYVKNLNDTPTFLYQMLSPSICNFAVFEDYVWIVNGQNTPVVWNGISVAPLVMDGSGNDYDGNIRVDLSGVGGKYIFVHQERLFIANTLNNKSEILYSRFYNNSGTIIKATRAEAWVSSNQIIVNTSDGYEITSANVFLGNVVVIKEKSFYIIGGTAPEFSIIKLPFEIRAYFHDTVKIMNNALYFLGHNGIYRFTGTVFEFVTDHVEKLFEGAKQFISRAFRRALTSENDFRDAASIQNIATLGYASGSLRLPKTRTNPFVGGAYNNTTLNGGEIQLVALTSPTITLVTPIVAGHNRNGGAWGGTDYGSVSPPLVHDGDFNTYNDVGTSFLSSWTNAWLYPEFTFSAGAYVDNIRVKVAGVFQYASGSIFGARVYIKTTPSGAWTEHGSSVISVGTIYSIEERQSDFTVPISAVIYGIKVECEAAGARPSPPVAGTSIVIARCYEIAFNVSATYNPSGDFISREYDSGCNANEFAWAQFNASHTANGGNVAYAIGSYDTSGYGWNDIPPAQKQVIVNGQTPTIVKHRYYRIKTLLTADTTGTKTPSVSDFVVYFPNTGVWTSSPIFIGAVGKWGRLLADAVSSGTYAGTIKYEFRSAASLAALAGATYAEVLPSNLLNGAVGDNIYAQWRISLSRSSSTADGSVVNAINMFYMTGGDTLQNATAHVWNNKYFLSLTKGDVNDTVIVYSAITGAVSKFDNLNISCFSDWKDGKMIGGHSSIPHVFDLFDKTYTDDNGDKIVSYIRTKEIVADVPLADAMLRELYLYANTDEDSTIDIDIFVENRYYDTVSFEVSNGEIVPKKRVLTNGIIGKRFYFVIKNSIKGDKVRINGISAAFKPLRTAV